MTAGAAIRILGVSIADVSDWRLAQPAGKWTGLYHALADRFLLVDVVEPQVARARRVPLALRRFHPLRSTWAARAGLDPSLFRARSDVLEHALAARRSEYDVIVQLQTLCAPGTRLAERSYAVYTDNTYALTEREYPAWAPLSRQAGTQWRELERSTFRAASAVFAMSEWAARSVVEDYGCARERVFPVGGGANLVLETIDERRYDQQRALFVGLELERKGGAVLLEAWRLVRRRLPDAELVVAGLTRPRGVTSPPGVRWLGRVEGRAALTHLYLSASVFVLPSLFEPWGFVLHEAMGHGLGCIGTTVCAMPEIIEDGVTGWLVPPREPEALAGALVDALGNPENARATGAAAHREILARHRWQHVIERLSEPLQSAAGAAG